MVKIQDVAARNVSFNKGLSINKGEVKSTGKSRIKKGPKSKKSKRRVPLNNRMVKILTEWKNLCDHKRSGWSKDTLQDEKLQHVIVYPADGSLPYPDTCRKWVGKYVNRNNFDHITPHGFRHFFVTYLIENGIPINMVSDLSGHQDEATTLKIYTSVTKEGYDKAVAVLNAV